ncbi:hypothetical protein EMGBS15_12150, partial [Filimonas sp.]
MKNNAYLVFTLTTLLLLTTEYFLSAPDGYFTRVIVLAGTGVVGAISFLSYFISSRSVNSENPSQFVRGVMGGTFLKFFLCIVAVAVLLFTTQKKLHKPDLFLLMFVYLI